MAAWEFALIAFVVIAFPLLWVAMWWLIAKQAEFYRVQLHDHPSLKRYDRQMLLAAVVGFLFSAPGQVRRTVMHRPPSATEYLICSVVELAALIAFAIAWRNKVREIRRLAENEK